MDLIPYTNGKVLYPFFSYGILIFLKVGGWSHQHGLDNKFFWKDDIRVMAKNLSEYQEAVHLCKSGANQALEEFKRDRIEAVKDIIEVCIE
jgi:hypothetical protein